MRRVVITGAGILSPIGNTLDAASEALRANVSGVRAVPEWQTVPGLGAHVAGVVEGPDPQRIPRAFRRTMGRMAILGSLAAKDAVDAAGLSAEALHSDRAGVAMGSTTGSGPALEQFFSHYLGADGILLQEGTLFMKIMGHTVAANTAAFLGTEGRLLAPSTACASSTQAIGLGYEAIRDGYQDMMVCGGAEDLHPSTAGVFDVVHAASRAYNDSPSRTPRPFDRDRDGLVVSEGAAAVVLEDYDTARGRGARILAEIIGYATGCSARNMTSPEREGIERCMRHALDSAGVAPGDLDYINAHATATELGDVTEAEALRAVFGDRVPVSSTKGHTGHTLGACGAMEVVFCLLMMRDGFLAPTLNCENVDPRCDGIGHVRCLERAEPRLVMSCNFAFGGVNAALVLRKVDA